MSNFARKDFLLLSDIPSALLINSEIFSVTFSDSSAGDLHMSGLRDCYVSLEVALNMLITEYNAFLLTIEISTTAIGLDSKGNYKLFDSYSRDVYGKVSGTSILLEFDTILEVVLYLQNLYGDRSVVSFEVIGVKVSCLADHENSMNKTFGSQSDNPREHTFSGAESCYQRHETSHPISNENENQKSVLYLKRNEKCEEEIVSIRQTQAPPEKTHFVIRAYKCNMEERESCVVNNIGNSIGRKRKITNFQVAQEDMQLQKFTGKNYVLCQEERECELQKQTENYKKRRKLKLVKREEIGSRDLGNK